MIFVEVGGRNFAILTGSHPDVVTQANPLERMTLACSTVINSWNWPPSCLQTLK